MEDYFKTVLSGYRTETGISDFMLNQLPIFINATIMENIVDAFEVMKNNGDELEMDEELSYLARCIEENIPYRGFFHEMYSCEAPFQDDERMI